MLYLYLSTVGNKDPVKLLDEIYFSYRGMTVCLPILEVCLYFLGLCEVEGSLALHLLPSGV